ncbi:protein CHUP1, chloroplastic-like isoform X2 [Cajanus cajan]|nr:protein CHUP1, chloroplastic-like isoform X2 [Cajanus cajan]
MYSSPIWEPNYQTILTCVKDYMIIRVSFMVVASVAALKISQTKSTSSTKRNGSIKSQGSDGSHLEQEFEERENNISKANHVLQVESHAPSMCICVKQKKTKKKSEEEQNNSGMPQNLIKGEFKGLELLVGGEKIHNVTEKEVLQNLIRNYKQREVNLERKLLELNALREEHSAIVQMQKQLDEKTEKLDFLKKTIASLQSENTSILEKVREDLLSKKELDITNKMINEMKRKKEDVVRKQILMLQQQVTEFQKHNSSGRNATANKKLKEVQGMEVEVLELKRRNKELELEKREMGIKLVTAQARIRTEEERGARINEEITGLRQVHEELSEQVERLQRNRFDMVEELVYQRWLYSLLRFEVQDHQKQSRKASRRDCSQNSNKELCGEKHASVSDLEIESVSSNATLDENESDEIETNTTFESSSSSQSSGSSSIKMKSWRKIKDFSNKISSKGRNFASSPGMTRRFSMSMVESDSVNSPVINLSQTENSTFKSLESPIMSKIKRVSFSDSVKLSTYQDMAEEVENNTVDDKETRCEQIMELASSVKSFTNIDSIEENEGGKNNKTGHSDEVYSRNEPMSRKDNWIKTMLVQLVAFLFFSLILLACFMIK